MARVLLIDDDAQWRQIITDWLTRHGHEVVTATRVSEALEELRKEAAHESPTIHIVILDLKLDNGHGKFNGIDIIKHIPPRMGRVVLSGFSPAEVQEAVNPLLGVPFYFQKPLLRRDEPKRDDFADLLHIVQVAGEKRDVE